jgi:hypothetical protein
MRRISTDLIRENPLYPCHPCAILIVIFFSFIENFKI